MSQPIRVTTQSGAVYFFDQKLTEFQRDTDVPMYGEPLDPKHIYKLAVPVPMPVVGKRMCLPVENGLYVTTTPVVSVG